MSPGTAAATTTPCPKCAVAVPLGYVKCPRCHAAMPTAPAGPRAKRQTMRDAIAGGTAVPEPETAGFPWILALVCAAAATAAIVWYVSSGGARAAESPAAAASAPIVDGSAVAAAPGSAAHEVEPPAAPIVDQRPHQRADALAALEHALASDQLWATVTEAGDRVEIRSAFCADHGVDARLAAAKPRLVELGFHGVRCIEKGGSPVWARDL